MKAYSAIGLMSGTSLDGLDVAWCEFQEEDGRWNFQILKAVTVPYSTDWREKLAGAHLLPAGDLLSLHAEYGNWLGIVCKDFMEANGVQRLDCISSHGHTIFHQPQRSFTFQLGDGNCIHAETGLPVVFDFRSLDLQLGGQGAPLVPVGDKLLFSEFDFCLNLGGIANLTLKKFGELRAFDVCFANMGLNYLSGKVGRLLDEDGELAASGRINVAWLQKLNDFYKPFHSLRPSLAREHFESGLRLLLDDPGLSVNDKLRTFSESIAIQIAEAIPSGENQKILITGGGALNKFLVGRLVFHLSDKASVEVPSIELIQFKEALVFAFLGVLRLRKQVNVLKCVTRAARDSCSGVIIG